jgi:hypothetical protein
MWSRCPFPSLFYDWLSHVLTYATVLIEGAFPILFWFRKTKLPAIAAIVGLHVGIAVMLKNVTFFSLAMACSLSIFLPPEITRATLSRAHRWVHRFQRTFITFSKRRASSGA